jgi:hypothetical protein
MGPYIHIDENDVLKSYLAHIPRLGVQFAHIHSQISLYTSTY